jgi:hypothetical protein
MTCNHGVVCEDQWMQNVDLTPYMGRAIYLRVNYSVYNQVDRTAMWIESYPFGSAIARNDWLFGTGNDTIDQLNLTDTVAWEFHSQTVCLPAGTNRLTFNMAVLSFFSVRLKLNS